MLKISTEKFWELYKPLPKELKDIIFAEKTGEDIYEICKRNKVENLLGEIVDSVKNVLLGLLPPENFSKMLIKEFNIKKEIAEETSREINRFIFYPVRNELSELNQKGATAPKVAIKKTVIQPEVIKKTEALSKPQKKDSYREQV